MLAKTSQWQCRIKMQQCKMKTEIEVESQSITERKNVLTKNIKRTHLCESNSHKFLPSNWLMW